MEWAAVVGLSSGGGKGDGGERATSGLVEEKKENMGLAAAVVGLFSVGGKGDGGERAASGLVEANGVRAFFGLVSEENDGLAAARVAPEASVIELKPAAEAAEAEAAVATVAVKRKPAEAAVAPTEAAAAAAVATPARRTMARCRFPVARVGRELLLHCRLTQNRY